MGIIEQLVELSPQQRHDFSQILKKTSLENIKATLEPDIENERRMDIFMCNTRTVENTFETVLDENIVVGLKAPKVPLTKKVLRQIEDYMDFVRRQPQFTSEFRKWKFIAVCKEIDGNRERTGLKETG